MKRVAIVSCDWGQLLDVAGPFDVFAVTEQLLRAKRAEPAYHVFLASAEVGLVTTSSGLQLSSTESLQNLTKPVDTLIVAGSPSLKHLRASPLVEGVRRAAQDARRVVSVCTGAFVLAEAGLLEGREATTHWQWCSELAKYPGVDVKPNAIFVQDGPVWTSAGVCSGIDLALALVEEDFGLDISLQVAEQLVLFVKRSGGQAQLSTVLLAQRSAGKPLHELISWIAENLDADLSVTALAARVAMSPRNFARAFVRALGVTPARMVERVRVEAARRALEQNQGSIEETAIRCGFGTAETMRRAFLRQINCSPSECRALVVRHASPSSSGDHYPAEAQSLQK